MLNVCLPILQASFVESMSTITACSRNVCRVSTATLLHLAGSSLPEAGEDQAECSHLGAEAGAAGHLQEVPPGSSGPALLVLGELSLISPLHVEPEYISMRADANAT